MKPLVLAAEDAERAQAVAHLSIEPTSIAFTVEGRPAPKGSRIQKRSEKTGKSYTFPASKFEKPWIAAVREATRVVMRHHAQPEPPYEVELEFILHRPKTRSAEHPTGIDLDKLVRAVIDGLVYGGAISDDRHVTRLTATKRYAEEGERTGVRVRLW